MLKLVQRKIQRTDRLISQESEGGRWREVGLTLLLKKKRKSNCMSIEKKSFALQLVICSLQSCKIAQRQ